MKKFNKSKYGFTLVEMVTVIAIILILALTFPYLISNVSFSLY